jgi:hypothetical protein
MLAKRMQMVFSRQICGVGFLWGVKQPQPNGFVIQLNFGFPLIVFSVYAGVARFVISAFLVLRVFGICGFSQIAQSVVRSVFVDVVKLMRRPASINVQPCQPMRGVQNVVYPNTNVIVSHAASSRVAGAATSSGFIPCKLASINIVIDEFTKSRLRQLFGVHDLNDIKQAGCCQA